MTEEQGGRETIARYIRAIHDQDYEVMASLQHPDYIEDYPQSGERIRGRANLRKILEAYPGGLQFAADLSMDRVIGGEDRWAIGPMFSMVRVSGAGDTHTAILKLKYPDGSAWYMVALVELKDGLLYRTTSFFAPEFEPPEWRSEWVEPIPGLPGDGAL